ncbi:MAG: hypothetical protein K8R53_02890, partial [Bacteroidales bacterium]|nr:hypothetical protein [Bacteroidales bacterium]
MKKSYFTALLTFSIVLLFVNEAYAQKQIPGFDPYTADYWLHRMNDRTENYYQLVEEFENFFEGKTPSKNSGYKLFRRWMILAENYIDENGNFLHANHLSQEYKKFNEQYAGEAIVGTWTSVGPVIFPQQTFPGQCPALGRISAIEFHPTDPNTIFVGTPNGGLWKSTNGGITWSNLNTDTIPTIGISDIVIDPVDPSVMYIGTGDRDHGDCWDRGVYKSTDYGNTWYPHWNGMGLLRINKLLINPVNNNILIAATSNGIYKTYNKAGTWYKMGGSSPPTGYVMDLDFKPGDPSVMYATQGGSFYKSTNYGDSWAKSYLSYNSSYRMAIGVTPANPNKVYLFATYGSEFFRLFV